MKSLVYLFFFLSDDPGSDSSADDGLPLHLERFAKVYYFNLG